MRKECLLVLFCFDNHKFLFMLYLRCYLKGNCRHYSLCWGISRLFRHNHRLEKHWFDHRTVSFRALPRELSTYNVNRTKQWFMMNKWLFKTVLYLNPYCIRQSFWIKIEGLINIMNEFFWECKSMYTLWTCGNKLLNIHYKIQEVLNNSLNTYTKCKSHVKTGPDQNTIWGTRYVDYLEMKEARNSWRLVILIYYIYDLIFYLSWS